MPLTATPTRKPAPQKAPKRGATLAALNDQLDSEWTTLKQDTPDTPDAALLAYYHTCMRVALHWIDGNPYTWQPPTEYAGERLSKMCGYLRGLEHADKGAVKAARELMLKNLRDCWPAYAALNYPDMPEDWPGSVLEWEVPPFSWAGLETSWDGQNWEGNGPGVFLPAFRYKESADFHLSALALLFLNKQLKFYLTDLEPHPTKEKKS